MDTKKKTRPDPKGARRAPAGAAKAAHSGKAGTSSKQRPQRRQEESVRRNRTPQGVETAHRSREAEIAALRQRNAYEPEAPAQPRQRAAVQNATEQVFRMEGQERQKKRVPQDPAELKRAQQRKRSAQRSRQRKHQAAHPSRAPKVVYTQPMPFNLNKLLLQLAVVMAVVISISLGLSVFFKVDKVVVYGNKAYSAWAVQEASGIEGGEKLLTFGKIRASGKIKAALPYVETVRIGINLPDTVNIYLTEYDVVYAIQDKNSAWWLMTSDGRVMQQTDSGTASSYTKVLGVALDSPVEGQQAVAYQEIVFTEEVDTTDPAEMMTEVPPVTVTAAQQLNAALEILECLELNDLVGEVASVDVTSLNNMELWYGNQYQVRLGSATDSKHKMSYKIASMNQSIAQLSDYQTGILDVSFTTWEEKVGYTPFE